MTERGSKFQLYFAALPRLGDVIAGRCIGLKFQTVKYTYLLSNLGT